MFTVVTEGKDINDCKEETSDIDLNHDIGKLSVSSQVPGPLFMRADESPMSLVRSELSGANHLLPSFDSISLAELHEQQDDVAKETIRSSGFDPICGAIPSEERVDEGKETIKFESSHSVHIAGPTIQRDDESEDVVKDDNSLENNHPLIVYESTQKSSGRKIKLNQYGDCQKRSRKGTKTAKKNLPLDLSSLKISRRRRSLFCKRARSSVWGSVGNILQDSEEQVMIDPNLGNQKQRRKVRGGQGNGKTGRKQAGRLSENSTRKRCTPTGHISLKVRIGKESIQTCPIGNDMDSFRAMGKSIPELFKKTENKLEEEVPNNHPETNCLEEVDNFGASIDNRCSDSGTSPDSEVINSVPEPPIFGKGLEENVEMNPSSGLHVAQEPFKSQSSETLFPCTKGKKVSKSSRTKEGSKHTSGILDLSSKKGNPSKSKGNQNKSVGKRKVKEKGDTSRALCRAESHLGEENQALSHLGESDCSNKTSTIERNSLQSLPGGAKDQYVPRDAWGRCDDCHQWRRIPATLADLIGDPNYKWTCKDNKDKDFADCSIPQEKSNIEINEELGISDGSCEDDSPGVFSNSNLNQSTAPQHSFWKLIKSNLFLHRSRKSQTIDEIMVCHCKPPSEGRMGCGAKCLNRMLNIECVQGTCPCGELCSNQQFQKRKYAKLKWFRCGRKGYGLQAHEHISEGQFLIEYVGEVLDVHAYEARQREYALEGHKHFYFMTLNGSEIIDACAKGNLGRFINHSCNPNCRTEKWMVNGEVCVGLFALRDIKQGEEVTFDYNYVRVFGAAVKKCVCGSTNCRGYIGGDPSNAEVIVQGDSDEEYPEPVMICEGGETDNDWNGTMTHSSNDEEITAATKAPENKDRMNQPECIAGHLENISETHTSETSTRNEVESVDPASGDVCLMTSMCQRYPSVQPIDVSLQPDDLTKEAISAVEHEFSTTERNTTNSLFSAREIEMTAHTGPPKKLVKTRRKLKSGTGGRSEEFMEDILPKSLHSSSTVKKGKLKTDAMTGKRTPHVDKSIIVPCKPKRLPELSLNSHFEAVEEKLNELLDPEGGISKRKDASRGYLKLLFLTAASGNNGHGEAIQSNRDLSMILDAILKTKSRTVLIDIINKNGLQMLHNIMKRYRREYTKTPILRKLLKVLEYLAMREILTLEHISGGPACPGVESFKDSILILTEHADKQVHQIARNFRDKWIPRHMRKNGCMDRVAGRMEFHPRSSYTKFSAVHDHGSQIKPSQAMVCFEMQSMPESCAGNTGVPDVSASGDNCGNSGTKKRKRKSRWDNPLEACSTPNINGDGPPGFLSPCNDPMPTCDASLTSIDHQEGSVRMMGPFDVVLGDSQHKFISRLSVSYGVPFTVIKQYGGHEAEASKGWAVAPGVPFHPFPPLPPYPRDRRELPASAANCPSLGQRAEKAEAGFDHCTDHSDESHTRKPKFDSPDMNISDANDRYDFQQGGSSYNLGRNYFRQQKWNHSKLAPPWVRNRNVW
ncbi:histone-lysine N-methyltransferase ASHH2-like [Olea europaea subsp. europaea]|uniref:Histone-lysine N-methyltransferase ASHH2-like n=1 Tax=Olea europaea subsp. europaea TaxID=158383 RepID=A0A8S0SI83_OLEEU|nr:histone-lysine N-methyltransferase ASHH2-like [Olea europaea subsp. europaea]